jgi:catechol 2,3-dioxygenase-like lactoylglutathione lyase family enzyme
MKVTSLDHLVLTVADLDKTVAFYCDVLGMTREDFKPADGSVRTALKFGDQKINLHVSGGEFDPKAQAPTPGSADLCFLSDTLLDAWQERFDCYEIAVEEGPVRRTGATGPIWSLYVRDPDGNLIEVSVHG